MQITGKRWRKFTEMSKCTTELSPDKSTSIFFNRHLAFLKNSTSAVPVLFSNSWFTITIKPNFLEFKTYCKHNFYDVTSHIRLDGFLFQKSYEYNPGISEIQLLTTDSVTKSWLNRNKRTIKYDSLKPFYFAIQKDTR